ncbi:MAG: hypothetical protein JW990_17785 [Thermoleophilia bacterium]|nr:hypothetical protein [Thermoleophilia bacterium]
MEQDQLRRIAEQFLCPFFSGARLAGAVPSTTREQLVARPDPRSLAFKVHSNDAYRLVLRRGEKFGPTAERIVKAFVKVMGEIEPALSTAFEADVLRTLPGKVVARSIGGDHHESMLVTIDWLEDWADRHYEGMSVTGALGFDPHVEGGSIGLTELSSLEFAAVLSNSVDTLVWVDPRGRVVGHECLTPPAAPSPFAPHAHAALAAWAVDGRVVLVLTDKDEILVFKDSQLLFAKRSGRWHFLTHRPFVTRMPVPNSLAVRQAVYESCLDVSFAHRGACLGVVAAGCGRDWWEVVMREDRLCNKDSLKARALDLLLAGRTFPELDRRFRMELLSIDGATVIDHQGRVLAVGAILKIPGGSTGGGRLAAARVLAKLGLGIKVSQDGSIVCFHGEAVEPVFTLM